MYEFDNIKYTTCISKVMNNNLQLLTPLLHFTSDYEYAVSLWKKNVNDPKFQTILQNARTSGALGFEKFETIFIQPVQRITRYALLLKQVKKTTPPKHPDFIPLIKTLINFEQFCEEANKRIERRISLFDLARVTHLDICKPNRLLMFSAQSGSKKKGMVHVMSDLVLVVTYDKRNTTWNIITNFELSQECSVSTKENTLILEKAGTQTLITLTNKTDSFAAKNYIVAILAQHSFNEVVCLNQ
ncbi:hypothetical protein EIN_491690 [Entamoeba invadens IP1]|uniref:DH domain-containing protein n=1 Tax=Entamoeba invadens IP1 TaxID=370355 RepID=A0A0A1U473_ENTIV|nr:hypothetical protein EIN_491690 [Entamoeba invadens IP1]ELP88970.1 hypothetical protein EIN_491690 [Entamoeba invadens IP1]|eukprot:XP_004255741.1 hypothetical protein EIN_491690 [Entamoeba invadens IP1]